MPGDEAKIRREMMLNIYLLSVGWNFCMKHLEGKQKSHDISHLPLCA
jgi:hypothetical protein